MIGNWYRDSIHAELRGFLRHQPFSAKTQKTPRQIGTGWSSWTTQRIDPQCKLGTNPNPQMWVSEFTLTLLLWAIGWLNSSSTVSVQTTVWEGSKLTHTMFRSGNQSHLLYFSYYSFSLAPEPSHLLSVGLPEPPRWVSFSLVGHGCPSILSFYRQKQHLPCSLSRPNRLGAGRGNSFLIRGHESGNI